MSNKIPNITFKSLLQPIKDIEERNAYFDYLTDEGKRLEIAWDTLQLLSNSIINGSNGNYWSFNLRDIRDNSTGSKDFQTRLNSITCELECRVCARGAMMLSQIRLGNSIDPNDHSMDNITHGYHTTIKGFSYEDFINMEKEYECCTYGHPYSCNTNEKLMNMCCNILVNGNFNTKDKTDYLK